MENLKQRWGIKTNLDLILIFVVFSINGSFASYIARPLTEVIGLHYETTSGWLFWPIRILLVFVVYQTTLPMVGWLFGQFKFFWAMEKKMLRRIGFKRFFKENNSEDTKH
jgi:manganese efflux pump family protein